MPRSATVAFDVYGTLGDVSRMSEGLAHQGEIGGLASRWRSHQLEISWLLTVMGHYEDFETVTAYALDVALADCGVRLSDLERRRLLRNAERLETFPDVGPALEQLRMAGFPLAVLSNGSPRMLESALETAGIRDHFGAVISAHEVRAYKPAPAVYRHAARRLGTSIGDIWLVSGNAFDAAGAKAAGMRVAKVEREPSLRYPFAGRPDLTLSSLEELAAELVEIEGAGGR